MLASFIQSEDVYLLTNAPKVITNEIIKSLQTGLFSSKDIKMLSSEESALCIEEKKCIDAIRKKNSKCSLKTTKC